MKILLSFIGNNDCYPNEKPGAILSILHNIQFDKIYILYNNEKYLKPASEILKYCSKHFPKLKVLYKETIAQNPIDYNTVYPAMYKVVKEILNENDKAEYTISITSGTPTMHACWIFLKQGGVIDAKLIQVSRESEIAEVNFELDDFPQIQHVENVKAELTKLNRENIFLKNRLNLRFDDFIGECPEIKKVKEQIVLFSNTNIPIFIQGETGTGKEIIAELIHYNSSRKEKSIIRINCGAIPSNLFESEFFGYKKGAFTGAITDKDGKFKIADEGTIFLDEIADLPLDMQVKLLRVMEDGIFIPVGDSKEIRVDVRIISATNRNIRELVKSGDFREDLFYRLVHTEINLPPLKDRGNDKILITETILNELNGKYENNKTLHKFAINKIMKYQWPGNVRQLKNVLETAYIYPGNEISAEKLNIIDPLISATEISIPDEGLDFEKDLMPQYYEAALKKTNGNAAKAAKLLNIKPHTFRARLKAIKSKNNYAKK